MQGILVDSNVVLDLFLDNPVWAEWSQNTLAKYSLERKLYINSIVYTEVSIGFEEVEKLESALFKAGLEILDIPKEALFLAGKAYLKYRRNDGTKSSPLPDFYIGAQAAVYDLDLVTRDVNRYRTYFPTVELVCPE
mgnify:CR=1 FL=1